MNTENREKATSHLFDGKFRLIFMECRTLVGSDNYKIFIQIQAKSYSGIANQDSVSFTLACCRAARGVRLNLMGAPTLNFARSCKKIIIICVPYGR